MEGIIVNKLGYPILTVTTFLPLIGVFFILFLRRAELIRWFSLAFTVGTFIVSLPLYAHFDKTTYRMQFVE
ncbi:MAG: NADH-quinone oxidoreductase subunit M, partial [Thermodesulfovibrionia bacterium]|nr:NADH-quinone oxidoreductase subunit M [Thermodesulfovibrionia bacterium]